MRLEAVGHATVVVEGDPLAFNAGETARPGETRAQVQSRAAANATQRGHRAQPDNTPHVDEVGDDRRAHQRRDDSDEMRLR